MAPRKRFNPVEFYRKSASAKPLSVKAPPRRRTSATAPQLNITGHLFKKGGKLIAGLIESYRDEEDRENMQKALMAFRSGLPGQEERINTKPYTAMSQGEFELAEKGIMDKYAQPAKDRVLDRPDEEIDEEVERQANQAWYNALPRVDKEGRYTEGKRLEGIDAFVAAAGEDRGLVTQEMLNTLMLSDIDRRRAKEAATLLHQRRMEYKAAPGSSRSEGHASRQAAGLQLLDRQNLLRDDLERAISNEEGPAATGRIRDEIARLDVIINRSPDHRGRVAAAKTGGTGTANRRLKDYSLARNATNNIKDIDMLISRLHSTDEGVVGFLVDLRVFRDQALAKFGSQEALARVTDTQMVNTLTGKEVFPLIKALGIGARGLDTPAERKFLREVLTGDKGLTKATLLEMAAMRRKVQVRNIERWNKDFNDGSLNDFLRTNNIPNRAFAMPPPAPVHTPIDITGPVSKMTGPQLNALYYSGKATLKQIEQIKIQLKKIGFGVTR